MSEPVARLSRRERFPNANNPQLLGRVLALVAQGVRRPRSLAELLDCEIRTVHYYLQAGEWLGFLSAGGAIQLSRRGLEYVYGGGDRRRLYAEAVWAQPAVQELMAGRDAPPGPEALAAYLQEADPAMAASTARRRASSIRGLLGPALAQRSAPADPGQLALELSTRSPAVERLPPGASETPGRPSPEVYLFLLRQLLDSGELTPGQLRALLDRAGGRSCPVGDYIEMAVRRGDAIRVQDRLVVTRGAAERAPLTDTAAGIALSDPGYREYLALVLARPGAPRDLRYGKLRRHYAPWDERIFGARPSPEQLASALDRILLGRPLDAFPIAGPTGPKILKGSGHFLERFGVDELAVAMPAGLQLLAGGVRAINQLLSARGTGGAGGAVRPPTIVDPRARCHGGLCAPGEAPPRAIPDTISLRLRALSRAPYLAMATALLLAHRRSGARLAVRRSVGGLTVLRDGDELGGLVALLDRYGERRGWLVSRRRRGGLDGAALAGILDALGVAARLRRLLVLAEPFFERLQSEVEDREIYELLRPVEDDLVRFLCELEPAPALGGAD